LNAVADPLNNVAHRPDTGWPVWGQPSAVSRLRQAIQQGPAHAYILAGPRRSGKRTAALDFARALNCPNAGSSISSCGDCAVCRRIGRGVFPDVSVFDLASQAVRDGEKSRNLTLNIATVREISSALAYRPTESPWQIAIVDDAETMQETAQEAFLKTLEEPPSYAILLLLTTDSESLLPTIQSRCVTIRFGLVPESEIEVMLTASGFEQELARRVSGFAQGSAGWAIEAANNPTLIETREGIIDDATRFVLANAYDRIILAVRHADDFARDRESVFIHLDAVQSVWRSALYANRQLGNIASVSGLGGHAERFVPLTLEDLLRSIRSVDTCVANLEANVRPRLALESMVLAWPRLAS
jgi:DNA polymerase-3 subunit delta'